MVLCASLDCVPNQKMGDYIRLNTSDLSLWRIDDVRPDSSTLELRLAVNPLINKDT